jgi:hypothetical protein
MGAVVSPACLKLVRSIVSVLSLRFRSRAVLEQKTSPSVTSCMFFVANDRIGPGCLRQIACSGSGSTDGGRVA